MCERRKKNELSSLVSETTNEKDKRGSTPPHDSPRLRETCFSKLAIHTRRVFRLTQGKTGSAGNTVTGILGLFTECQKNTGLICPCERAHREISAFPAPDASILLSFQHRVTYFSAQHRRPKCAMSEVICLVGFPIK